MKKAIILVLICLLIVPVLSARDGHYWKDFDKLKDSDDLGDSVSVLAKTKYLNGMIDGLGFLSDRTAILVEVLNKTALSNEKNLRLYIDMLDDFYKDYANLDIEIIDALTFCLLRLKGIHDDDTAKEELRILRKIEDEIKNMMALSEKVVRDNGLYQCIRVIDGDTIVVKKIGYDPVGLIGEEIKVRLIGVDCPELDEPGGEHALLLTIVYAEGQRISLFCGERRKDVYGRTLAYVNVHEEGEWLNEILIEKGNGRVLSKYLFAYMAKYKRLEVMAKLNKLGIWAEK